jgi:hypothetical protein
MRMSHCVVVLVVVVGRGCQQLLGIEVSWLGGCDGGLCVTPCVMACCLGEGLRPCAAARHRWAGAFVGEVGWQAWLVWGNRCHSLYCGCVKPGL